jgi:hypothetical protein
LEEQKFVKAMLQEEENSLEFAGMTCKGKNKKIGENLETQGVYELCLV